MNLIIALVVFIFNHAPQLVGIILPPFITILNRDVKSEAERFIVSGLICILCAAFIDWDQIMQGSPEQAGALAAIIFAESQTIFKLYFKNSFVNDLIKVKLLGVVPPAVNTVPVSTTSPNIP